MNGRNSRYISAVCFRSSVPCRLDKVPLACPSKRLTASIRLCLERRGRCQVAPVQHLEERRKEFYTLSRECLKTSHSTVSINTQMDGDRIRMKAATQWNFTGHFKDTWIRSSVCGRLIFFQFFFFFCCILRLFGPSLKKAKFSPFSDEIFLAGLQWGSLCLA